MKNFLRNMSGFSLVELMVAAGLLGGLTLGVVKIMGLMQKGQKTSEIKMEVLELRRKVVTLMTDKIACEATFLGPNLKIGDPVNHIKGSSGANIISVGNVYGNKRLKVTSISTTDKGAIGSTGMREVVLRVDFDNLQKNNSFGGKKYFKTTMTVEATGPTAPITRCFDDRENTIKTARAMSCEDIGGTWDEPTYTCTQFVRKNFPIGAVPPQYDVNNPDFTESVTVKSKLLVSNIDSTTLGNKLTVDANEILALGSITADSEIYGKTDLKADGKIFNNNASLAANGAITTSNTITANGRVYGKANIRADGKIFNNNASINTNGAILTNNTITATKTIKSDQKVISPLFCTSANGFNCGTDRPLALGNQTCGNNQVQRGIDANGKKICVSAKCASGQYLEGFDGSGKVCKPFPDERCGANQYVVEVKSDGTVVCGFIPSANTTCGDDQFLHSINNYNSVATCRKDNRSVGDCSNGEFIRGFASNGNKKCERDNSRSGKCGSNQYLEGFDSNGNKICKNLNRPNGKSCPNGQYMSGIASNGNLICKSLPKQPVGDCGGTAVKRITSSGQVQCVNNMLKECTIYYKFCRNNGCGSEKNIKIKSGSNSNGGSSGWSVGNLDSECDGPGCRMQMRASCN